MLAQAPLPVVHRRRDDVAEPFVQLGIARDGRPVAPRVRACRRQVLSAGPDPGGEHGGDGPGAGQRALRERFPQDGGPVQARQFGGAHRPPQVVRAVGEHGLRLPGGQDLLGGCPEPAP